jgi:group II intron reverse transcriptase/maturase
MMDGRGESDRPVVPTKSPNNAAQAAAEGMEGRGLAKENTSQQNASRTQSRISAPSALARVRQAARRDKEAKFTALFHHITTDLLRTAFGQLKKHAAAGVDGVTWEQYGVDLEENLRDLHDRLRRGAYRARPSRRVYIPKADGRQRPLGIASLEDKIVQRAVVEVLNAIYEEDFLGFSYGFRPRRSQHQALDALAVGIGRKKVNWVLDADIRGFYDTIDHGWLVKFLEHRIGDKKVLRLCQKWLAAGVLEDGKWTECEQGTPQGATVSPLLSNVYLHYVFDLWVQQWRKRKARGDVVVVRYADDVLVGFQHEWEAKQFLEDLRERMRKFALELHPDKTRLVRFGRTAKRSSKVERDRAGTFDFLGFTHICGKSRAGKFLLVRRTMRKRMQAKLTDIKSQLQLRRHQPIPEQGRWLGSVVRGFFAYHAVPTNSHRMGAFRLRVSQLWRQSLRRRSQRSRITQQRIRLLTKRWLPPTRVQHPWPSERFDARIQGKSPVR